mgnify:CR=1 FL=1
MPIYEYQCQGCNHALEKLQKISDEPLSVCPQCGEPQLKRKISAAGFRLKGGGWYETDFKSGSKKNLAGDGGGDSGGSAKSDSSSAPAVESSSPSTPPASASTT